MAGFRAAFAETIFGEQRLISDTVEEALAVVAADFDGDGDRDVLSASVSTTVDRVAWYESDGAGGFGTQQVIEGAKLAPTWIQAADLDGDLDPDVLTAASSINWYENTGGAPRFGARRDISSSVRSPRAVEAVDIDRDGDLDVLSGSAGDSKVAWYPNEDGRGGFGQQKIISAVASNTSSAVAGDVDGDGDADVLFASNNRVAWHENTNGRGTFGQERIVTTDFDGVQQIVATDLEGDLRVDVLGAANDQASQGVVAGDGDRVVWYRNTDGRGAFAAEQPISVLANEPTSILAADADGDGDADVFSTSYGDNKLAWHENLGGGGFGPQHVISTAFLFLLDIDAADLDGDGRADVLSASAKDKKLAWHENLGDRKLHFPVAEWTALPLAATAGAAVTLDASASSTPAGTTLTAFSWDLGDGVRAEGARVEHTYTAAGRYHVTLTVGNDRGDSDVRTGDLVVRCPSGDLSPWTATDIGAPAYPGTAALDASGETVCLELCAGGNDIALGSDQLTFVHRQVVGDFVLTARISELSSKTDRAKVGAMLRESTEPGSAFAAMLVEDRTQVEDQFRFSQRATTGGSERGAFGDSFAPPWAWVQLRREGQEVIGLSSEDGFTWKEVGRLTVGLGPAALVGLAATGKDLEPDAAFTPLAARLCEIQLESSGSVSFRRGDANADGGTNLSDAVYVLNHLFAGGRGPDCLRSADVDDSGGAVNISDPIFLLGHLFLSGLAPPPPYESCGDDSTADEQTCERFAACE